MISLDSADQFSESGGQLVVQSHIAATALLLIAAAVAASLRKQSAALRHRVWLVSLTALPVLPIFIAALPNLGPKWTASTATALPNPKPRASEYRAESQDFTIRNPFETARPDAAMVNGPEPTAAQDDPALERGKRVDDVDTEIAPVVEGATDEVSGAPDIQFTRPFPWIEVFAVWVAGCVASLALFLVRLLSARGIVRRALPVEETSMVALADELRKSAGVRSPVPLRCSGEISVPMTMGLCRCVIVLPPGYGRWTPQRRRVVLAHELAHIRRGDVLAQTAGRLCCALYWCHPLVWLALRGLNVERERACDDAVLRMGEIPCQYADHLVDVAAALLDGARPLIHAVAMSRRSSLEDRVEMILRPTVNRSPVTRRAAVTLTTVAVGVVVLLGLMAPPSSRQESKPSTQSTTNEVKHAQQPTRSDDDFDPIPAGADVRLGSGLFRASAWRGGGFAFSHDGKFLICPMGNDVGVLNAQTGRLIRRIDLGPGNFLKQFELTPDGNGLIVLTHKFISQNEYYSTIHFFDASGRSQSEFTLPANVFVEHFAYLPDEDVFITAGGWGEIRVWDKETQEELKRHKMPENPISHFAVAPDGRTLALVAYQSVYTWDWKGDADPQKLEGVPSRAYSVEFSPDGDIMIIGCMDVGLVVWDVDRSTVMRVLGNGLPISRMTITFLPNGNRVAASDSYSKAVFVWDVRTGKRVKEFTCPPGPGPLAVSADGQRLASMGTLIHVWDVQTGANLTANKHRGHTGTINGITFAETGEGTIAVTSSRNDETVRVWDVATGKQRRVFQHERVWGIDVSPDGSYIVSSGLDDTVRMWDVTSGAEIYRLPGNGNVGGRRSVDFTRDGRQFATFGDDRYLRVWDVRTGRALSEVRVNPAAVEIEEDDEDDPKDWLWRADCTELVADGTRLLMSKGKEIYVFDVQTGLEQEMFESETFGADAMAVSPDGTLLLTLGRTPRTGGDALARTVAVLLRDFQSGEVLWQMDLPKTTRGAVAFSGNGRRMAVALGEPYNQIRVWEVKTKQEIKRVENLISVRFGSVLALSPDGRWLGCAATDGTALIWDLEKLP